MSIYFICHILHILHVAARIGDGDEIDDWNVTDHRTGNSVPLRASRGHGFQSVPTKEHIMSGGDLRAFESTFGTEPKFDASLHTLSLEVAVIHRSILRY